MTNQIIYGIVPPMLLLTSPLIWHLVATPQRLQKERVEALEAGERTESPEPPPPTVQDAEREYERLGWAEKHVLDAFVVAGGCPMT